MKGTVKWLTGLRVMASFRQKTRRTFLSTGLGWRFRRPNIETGQAVEFEIEMRKRVLSPSR
jgi:hypothetical protein